MDQSYWTDPEVFRPERHLNSSGKLVKSDHFMPFGGGEFGLIEARWRLRSKRFDLNVYHV